MRYIRIISLFNSLLLSANVAADPALVVPLASKPCGQCYVRESVVAQKTQKAHLIQLVFSHKKISGAY